MDIPPYSMKNLNEKQSKLIIQILKKNVQD